MGLDPAHRTQHRFSFVNLRVLLDATTKNTPEQKEIRAAYTSRFFQALIKIYTPCNLPNLFSCQISSSPACTGCPPKRVWIVPTSGCATPPSSNPMFGVKRLS